MWRGDISNEMPKRVLVNADVLFIRMPEFKKKFKLFTVKTETIEYDRLLLNKFYIYTTHAGVTLELVSFEFSYDEMEKLYNDLDRVGTNPFRYFSSYSSPRKLASDLAYRPEVIGVIDPENKLVYGRLGMDF